MKIFYQTFSITTKLISILILFIFAQSCTKEPSCNGQSDTINSYYISADDKSKIPFKGNNTLTYISNAGDTAMLIGNGKREFIDKVQTVIAGNADCYIYNVDYKETISIEYTGDNLEFNRIKYKIYGNKEKTEIEFKINSYY